MLSDQSEIILAIENKRHQRKYLNTWRLYNTLLNDQLAIEEIRG
jgi:hypothetical protein